MCVSAQWDGTEEGKGHCDKDEKTKGVERKKQQSAKMDEKQKEHGIVKVRPRKRKNEREAGREKERERDVEEVKGSRAIREIEGMKVRDGEHKIMEGGREIEKGTLGSRSKSV